MPATWSTTLWTDDIQSDDHRGLALARLIWEYRGDRPRIQGMLDALLEQVQNLENLSIEVLTGRWPLTAEGAQLDLLGRIVREARGSLTDPEYRLMILLRILVNRSDGTLGQIEEIIETAKPSGSMQIDESYPCGLMISVAGVTLGWLLGEMVADAVSAGVACHWSWTEHDDADAFAMGDALGSDEANVDGGFGDLTGATQTSGGHMTGGAKL